MRDRRTGPPLDRDGAPHGCLPYRKRSGDRLSGCPRFGHSCCSDAAAWRCSRHAARGSCMWVPCDDSAATAIPGHRRWAPGASTPAGNRAAPRQHRGAWTCLRRRRTLPWFVPRSDHLRAHQPARPGDTCVDAASVRGEPAARASRVAPRRHAPFHRRRGTHRHICIDDRYRRSIDHRTSWRCPTASTGPATAPATGVDVRPDAPWSRWRRARSTRRCRYVGR